MQMVIDFLKKTVIGGLLFLIPIVAIVFLVGKLVSALRPVGHSISDQVLGTDAIGPLSMILIVSVLLLAISFLAGLVALTVVGQRTIDWMESKLLSRVPGYTMVKNLAVDAADNITRIESGGRVKVVYMKADEGWRLGFVTDQVSDNLYAVFLPDAPSAFSGELLFAPPKQFVDSDLTVADAMKCLARLGVRDRPGAMMAIGSPAS